MAKVSSKRVNSREIILKVSIQLFAERGFEGVTMRQIAKESNVSLPAIYHHFGNKEELFKAVEKETYGGHTDTLMVELHADTLPEERLYNFILALIDRLDANPNYLKLLQRNLVEGWEENQKFLVDNFLQRTFDELKQLLNEFSKNRGDGIGPVIIFSMILGYLTMRPVTRMLKGYKYAKASADKKNQILAEAVLQFVNDNH